MTSDKALKLGFLLTATDQMSATLEKAGRKLTGFQNKIAKFGSVATESGGYFMTLGNQIGGGMLNVVRAATDYGDSAFKTAQKVGMQVEEWQKLAYAAELAGVGNDRLASGMAKFDKVLAAASSGTGGAARAFKDLGIQIKDAAGKIRAPQDILADVSNVFSRVRDGAEKSALAQELFGKSGAQLIPLLNSGAKGLEKMGREAGDMGLVLSGEAAKACEKFNDNLHRVNKSVLGLKIQIGAALAPVLEKVINKITAGIKAVAGFAKEHQTLTRIIGGAIAVIGGLLFGFGAISLAIGATSYVILRMVKVWKFFTAVIHAARYAVTAFRVVGGFLQVTLAGIRGATVAANAATRAYIVTQNSGVTTSIAYRTGQALSAAAQWLWNGAVAAGRAVMAFFAGGVLFTGIKLGALAVWQGVSTAAQWLFNAALYACPVVWIVAAIMAVIAAVVLMVKYWDDIVAFFKGVWEGIKNVFSSVGDWFSNLFSGIFSWFTGLPARFAEFGRNLIAGLIRGILGAVAKLWDTIKNIGRGIGRFFSKILGINSPSTVFAKYGMNITQGLVVGIDRGEDSVGRAAGGLAMHALGGYAGAMETAPATATGATAGWGGAFYYSPTVNIGAGAGEGTRQDFMELLRQHAREIADIMQRHADDKTRISFR
jgi:hypothetical protein